MSFWRKNGHPEIKNAVLEEIVYRIHLISCAVTYNVISENTCDISAPASYV
jgi:hypothetical protein